MKLKASGEGESHIPPTPLLANEAAPQQITEAVS